MTLPVSYSDKTSAIEETYDQKKFTREQLFGTLTAFEERNFGNEKEKLKEAFKAIEDNPNDINRPDEMESNFVRILKKGTSKYKIMLPFKCFRCVKIGHISTRCLEKGTR